MNGFGELRDSCVLRHMAWLICALSRNRPRSPQNRSQRTISSELRLHFQRRDRPGSTPESMRPSISGEHERSRKSHLSL